MKTWQKKCLWGGSIAVLLLALLVEFIPQEDSLERLLAIPTHGVGFDSQNTPLTEQERTMIGEANAIKRVILPEGGAPFLFSVIDGSHNRHAVHDPQYCFVGAGWEIVEAEPLPTERGELMVLQLTKDGENRQALYWFSDGEHWFTSPVEYWLRATVRRLSFGLSGDEPCLFIVQSLRRPRDAGELDIELLERLEPWK